MTNLKSARTSGSPVILVSAGASAPRPIVLMATTSKPAWE
jgi:hypothetical protein